ncbi:hypothetical protein BDZ97DRAFT_1663927 [Flammula alnicola]|nr:hypothetical protein BDZ97DRAFT_1663927 [Flammula alnicola]
MSLLRTLQLFTDLVFADFLVTYTPYVSRVVFHCIKLILKCLQSKLIPWFVSDVTPPGFKDTFSVLAESSFSPTEATDGPESRVQLENLSQMVSRWRSYLDIFCLSVLVDTPLGGDSASKSAEFWTNPRPYWDTETDAPQTFGMLKESGLVVFKGDLKLTGDVRWPAWTPFAEAIGPLAGSFPILSSLRTNKADVVVGVAKDVAERLDQSSEIWRVDGR